MILKFRDTDNDIHLIESDKIVRFCKETENSCLISLGAGFYIPINKSIEEVEKRLFQLGIKVTEF